MPGSRAKTAAIREAGRRARQARGQGGEDQGGRGAAVRGEEELALAPLANRVGMSKARAGQIVKAEERRQKEAAVLEKMGITVEVWPLAADKAGIWLLSGGDAWRYGPVWGDGDVHDEVERLLFDHGIDPGSENFMVTPEMPGWP